jgi:cell wall-active antibiotic response 4TMS protein YvqF
MTGSSLLQAIRGPVLLVALGLLMAADQLDRMSFSRTWPVLLILFGLFKLAEHLGPKDVGPPDLNQHDPGVRNQ